MIVVEDMEKKDIVALKEKLKKSESCGGCYLV